MLKAGEVLDKQEFTAAKGIKTPQVHYKKQLLSRKRLHYNNMTAVSNDIPSIGYSYRFCIQIHKPEKHMLH